ncbi:MAG: hypothetical protein JNK27_07265 [Chitinophagaceae bacterium]|nr:hypothetical protein [Chitinophagaceae bacterium]
MEVHAHTHTPRKKWTHYFWEFLMLFLAVFCGFLAEYQLEHKIERDRGKQYIRSFYEDMITDSSHFNELISKFQAKLSVLQNIAPCYDSLLNGQSQKCFESIFRNSIDFPDMVFTDRTIQQLKNAGGLRLLKAADADSILLYDNLLRKYKIAETSGFQEVQSELRTAFYPLVKYTSWKDWSLFTTAPDFTVYDGNNKELLNRYFNQLKMYTLWCWARLIDMHQIKKRNTELITFFKKENHF